MHEEYKSLLSTPTEADKIGQYIGRSVVSDDTCVLSKIIFVIVSLYVVALKRCHLDLTFIKSNYVVL